jgi:rubrerythrin
MRRMRADSNGEFTTELTIREIILVNTYCSTVNEMFNDVKSEIESWRRRNGILTYTPSADVLECPVCTCDIEGNAWCCKQCKHYICNPCMQQWIGSTEQYHIPENEGEEQYLWEGETHSTCPYCRADIWA